MEKVKPLNHSIQAFLKASRPIAVEGDFLVLEVFYKFHKDQLESEKCRKIVEQVCGQIFSAPFKLKFTLGERFAQKMNIVSVETNQAVASVQYPQEKGSIVEKTEEDIVKIAEEIFNGDGGIIDDNVIN